MQWTAAAPALTSARRDFFPDWITLTVDAMSSSAVLVLHLAARERVLSVTGVGRARRTVGTLAEHIASDRDTYDRVANSRLKPDEFDPNDTTTWTRMQLLVAVSSARWSLPSRFRGSGELVFRVNAGLNSRLPEYQSEGRFGQR